MPFKLSNILHKADRRASTSTTSSRSGDRDPSETRSLHEEPVTPREPVEASSSSAIGISASQSLSGPRLTVTDAADGSSPHSLRTSGEGFSGHYDPEEGWQAGIRSSSTSSASAPTSPVPPPRAQIPPLRVQTRSDSGRSIPSSGAGGGANAGPAQTLSYKMAGRHQFDDLETPTAAKSDGQFFTHTTAPISSGTANGIDGLPSRSYQDAARDPEVKPLTAENLQLAPALSPTLPGSSAGATAPPPPLPSRTSASRVTTSSHSQSHSVSPPDRAIPLHSPVKDSSASVVSAPIGSTLAPPGEPTTKRRAGSVSSQRSAPAVHGIGALVGSSLHAAALHPAPTNTSMASSHSTPGEVLKEVKAKVKDKVRRRRHRKDKDVDGVSNRGSMYSVTTNGDDDVLSQSGRPRSGTGGSSIKPRNGMDRRARAESNASSHRPRTEDGSFIDSEEDDEDDDASDDEYDDDDARSGSFMSRGSLSLPVTGFAVASNKRNMDFHALFPEVDEDDYLIEDYGCALQKDILVQGRIYASENHLCFHANIFGWVTNVVIPFSDVVSLEKKMTAFVIPNAICVSTNTSKHTFASFISRDSTYDVFKNIWRQARPSDGHAAGGSRVVESESGRAGSGPAASTQAKSGSAPTGGAKGAAKRSPTTCECGSKGQHYSQSAMDTTFPSSPEKIYNLMFTSGFVKDFMVNDQHLTNLEMSDWKPQKPDSNLLSRSMSYIKPLGGSIGPKQTKCHITDETDTFEPEKYISMITTTKTPDVPSGNVFSVKTRTCLTWAGANSTKVVVTTQCEFTGKSWIKNIIEKSAVDGQKSYHQDLEKAMRSYIKEHHTEFVGEGGEEEEADAGEDEKDAAVAALDKDTQDAVEAARRKREEDEQSSIQWAMDRIISGAETLGGGLWGLLKSIVDILRDVPVSKELVLALLIFVLLASNIWTYISLRSERGSDKHLERDARRRQRRQQARSPAVPTAVVEDDQIVEAVKAFFQDLPQNHQASVAPAVPTAVELSLAEEAKQVMAMLVQVEQRFDSLKARMAAADMPGTAIAPPPPSKTGSLDTLE